MSIDHIHSMVCRRLKIQVYRYVYAKLQVAKCIYEKVIKCTGKLSGNSHVTVANTQTVSSSTALSMRVLRVSTLYTLKLYVCQRLEILI